jgi:hypothetical protein
MSDVKHNNMGPVRPVDDDAKAVSKMFFVLDSFMQNKNKKMTMGTRRLF